MERIFIWEGTDKKGHYNVKNGTNDAHADNITNVLMKHPCRHNVSFTCTSVFLAGGNWIKHLPPHTKNIFKKINKGPASSGVRDALWYNPSLILEQVITHGCWCIKMFMIIFIYQICNFNAIANNYKITNNNHE